MRGDRATDAVRFSYLHFTPACDGGQRRSSRRRETSIAADRKAYGGEFVEGRRPAGRADPEEDRLALGGSGANGYVHER